MGELVVPTTLPIDLIDNRFIAQPKTTAGVTLTLLTDTGGGLLLTADAVKKANLEVYLEVVDQRESQTAKSPDFITGHWIPPVNIKEINGDFLILNKQNAIEESLFQNLDGLLGQAWFANRIWTFDYLNQQMLYHVRLDHQQYTEHQSVDLGFQKDQLGNRANSFPRIEAMIDGEIIDFLFDTGATVRLAETALLEIGDGGGRMRGTSFITEKKFNQWRRNHPDWRVIESAEEETKYPMIEVPKVTIAGYEVGPVWFTYRVNSSFHEYMSQWMDKSIEGALGGSIFQYFSITVDYPEEKAYFKIS